MKVSKLLLLLERTMNSLVSVTASSFGGGRQQRANQVQLRNVKFTPAIQQGILRIECETFTSSAGDGPYQTIIQLEGVEFIDDSRYNFLQGAEARDSAKYNTHMFTATDGNTYYASYDRVTSLDVKVRCTCKDFRWRFAYYNSGDDSLYGNPPPPYISQTDRPPANPSNTPGVCKHLMKLKKELEKEEFFRALLN